MELKDFIKKTISSIIDATNELQEHYSGTSVVINPPISSSDREKFMESDGQHIFRRIEDVTFDVAVTVDKETEAEVNGGIKIFSAQIGGSATHASRSEEVSRVKFSIPLALSRSAVADKNLQISSEKRAADLKLPESFQTRAVV